MTDVALPVREGLLVDVEQLRPGDVARLHGSNCEGCGRMEFPGRVECPWCGGASSPVALGPEAVLVGFTAVLHPAPGSLIEPPYAIGVGRFAGGIDVMGLLASPTDVVALGDPIEVCAFGVPDGRLTYSFRGVERASSM